MKVKDDDHPYEGLNAYAKHNANEMKSPSERSMKEAEKLIVWYHSTKQIGGPTLQEKITIALDSARAEGVREGIRLAIVQAKKWDRDDKYPNNLADALAQIPKEEKDVPRS